MGDMGDVTIQIRARYVWHGRRYNPDHGQICVIVETLPSRSRPDMCDREERYHPDHGQRCVTGETLPSRSRPDMCDREDVTIQITARYVWQGRRYKPIHGQICVIVETLPSRSRPDMCVSWDDTIQIRARYLRLASRNRPGHEMIPIRADPHLPDHDQIYAIKPTPSGSRPDFRDLGFIPRHPDQGQIFPVAVTLS
jgi:hypothetical protein